MFERLQKPFLTVETGEAYQPIRLTYELKETNQLTRILDSLKCCEKNNTGNSWTWYWRDECDDLRFESLDSFIKNPENPLRLGILSIRSNKFYLNLSSFKRACLAVPFFHRFTKETAQIQHADFINKVFGTDERLPHGFSELFKDDELDSIIEKRISDYEKVQHKCEHATSPEEAITILSEYTQLEAIKRLPYAERYAFEHNETDLNADVVFLSFYIFLRSRELVAIRRWFGNSGYSISVAVDETVEKVFGGMDIDIIE